MGRVNDFLDRHVLPYPVEFLTHRFIILITIALLLPLIVFANETKFVLAVNSYLNTMSVAVSSIVLLYATLAEIRDKQIAAMQEHRAQEDHQHVVEMHKLVLENMDFQHRELENLTQILGQIQNIAVSSSRLPHGSETDLRALHARGAARFTKEHVKEEISHHVRSLLAKRG